MTTDQDIAHVAASEKADVLHYEDLQHSAELSTDLREVKSGYFSGINLLGAVASISFSTTATYWAFIPATSIIVFIDRDIGPSPNPSQFAIVWTMASSIGFISTALSDKLGRRWFVIGASLLGLLGGMHAPQTLRKGRQMLKLHRHYRLSVYVDEHVDWGQCTLPSSSPMSCCLRYVGPARLGRWLECVFGFDYRRYVHSSSSCLATTD